MTTGQLHAFGIASIVVGATVGEFADRASHAIFLTRWNPAYDDSGAIQFAFLTGCMLRPLLSAIVSSMMVLLSGLALGNSLGAIKKPLRRTLMWTVAGTWGLSIAWAVVEIAVLNRFWP